MKGILWLKTPALRLEVLELWLDVPGLLYHKEESQTQTGAQYLRVNET
jgi:predicted alternative tryptophan synthase beta-subunit